MKNSGDVKSNQPVRIELASWPFLALMLAGVLVYAGTIGFLPIIGRDEPRYVQIAREMFASGDWVTPRLGGYTWFEKPILLYWLVASSFSVFGVSEWAARIGPALCGFASAVLVWWSARSINLAWARWSAIVLLTSAGMIAFSHGATFDIVLTFFVTLALTAWWKSHIGSSSDLRFLVIFWLAVALAFLTKGLVAFVLILGPICLYVVMARQWVRTGWLWGLPLALAVASAWYGPVIWLHGMDFVSEFFVQHHFQRFTSNKYKHTQPFWFYLKILPLLIFPWVPFLFSGVFVRKFVHEENFRQQQEFRLFSVCWLLVPILFFSASGSKLPGYILPALPAAAILAALSVSRWARRPGRIRSAVLVAVSVLSVTTILTTTCIGLIPAERKSTRTLMEAVDSSSVGRKPLVFFRTTPRPAEFYGAGRLVYGNDGEPARFDSVARLRTFIAERSALIMLAPGDCDVLRKAGIAVEHIASNGRLEVLLAKESLLGTGKQRSVA